MSEIKIRPKSYKLRRSFHLGDRWARLNFALRLIDAGEDFVISIPDSSAFEIVSSLDIPEELRDKCLPWDADMEHAPFLNQKIDRGAAAYNCNYFLTRVRNQPSDHLIGYCFTANWRLAEKIPPSIDTIIPALTEQLPAWTLVPIGKPFQNSVSELIESVSKLSALFCVDNGVAHVARSVGTPLFMIEHLLPLTRGFPPAICDYTRIPSSSDLVATFLRSFEGMAR